jgi:hypothetical protein
MTYKKSQNGNSFAMGRCAKTNGMAFIPTTRKL